MTPAELADRHPQLYHLSAPGAHRSIRRLGLLSTRAILDRLGIEGEERVRLLEHRRPNGVQLPHAGHAEFVINDNLPLTTKALANCLDDDLTPTDWLRLLNSQVYLWPSTKRLATLLEASTNRHRAREIIVFDTLSLMGAHADRTRLSPINGGSTIRQPARRGLATYTPLLAHDYRAWQKLRGKRDSIAEIAIDGGIPDAAEHIIEVRLVEP